MSNAKSDCKKEPTRPQYGKEIVEAVFELHGKYHCALCGKVMGTKKIAEIVSKRFDIAISHATIQLWVKYGVHKVRKQGKETW